VANTVQLGRITHCPPSYALRQEVICTLAACSTGYVDHFGSASATQSCPELPVRAGGRGVEEPSVSSFEVLRERAPIGWAFAAAAVVVLAACGGNEHNLRSVTTGGYVSCRTGRDPAACLRFLVRAVDVRSIRLTADVPQQVTSTCAQMTGVTELRVACPPVVPAGGVVTDHDLYGPQVVNRRSYSMSINNGQNPGRIHWEVGAIRGPARALWIFDRSNWDARPPKQPARLIRKRRYLGHVVTLYRFPDSDGQLEGHDAASATQRGITYFASIHGHSHDDGDIAMLLAILARNP
jgi:hypothetical protein